MNHLQMKIKIQYSRRVFFILHAHVHHENTPI